MEEDDDDFYGGGGGGADYDEPMIKADSEEREGKMDVSEDQEEDEEEDSDDVRKQLLALAGNLH